MNSSDSRPDPSAKADADQAAAAVPTQDPVPNEAQAADVPTDATAARETGAGAAGGTPAVKTVGEAGKDEASSETSEKPTKEKSVASPDVKPETRPEEKSEEKPEVTAEDKAKEPADKAAPAETKPKSSRLKKLVLAAAAAVAVGAVSLWAAADWYVYSRTVPRTVPDQTVEITVEDGDTATRVMGRMKEAGLDVSPFALKLAARMDGRSLSCIHTGLYRFEPGLTPVGILQTLANGALADRQLRIPDGAPVWEVMAVFRDAPALKRVSETMSKDELRAALGIDSESLEGWFAPDTYHYVSGSSDVSVMKIAVDRQKSLLNKAWSERKASVPLTTPYEALILASIIEKETGVKSDRHLVSSVFTNRLKLKMPLQTDPTVIYGLGPTWSGNLTKKDLQTATPYNTYKIPALPPTPISAPAYASIEAALNPADSEYLYFVARGDGTSEFSKTLKAHNRAVRQYILNRPKDTKNGAAERSAKQ